MEVGESMGFGGIIFPVIPGAKLTWSVTKPSGDVVELPGRANRLGVVRSFGAIPVDEPGLYRVNVDVQWGEMHGDVPGTYDGSFWHSAVPADNPETLSTTFEGLTRVDPTTPLRIPVVVAGGSTRRQNQRRRPYARPRARSD
ncbi:MAG: hypothetical protein M5R36_04355 [Deltaproteobacteria bacterium]|nr:hypothetical protein [Deltaproteobacteria bacterium]